MAEQAMTEVLRRMTPEQSATLTELLLEYRDAPVQIELRQMDGALLVKIGYLHDRKVIIVERDGSMREPWMPIPEDVRLDFTLAELREALGDRAVDSALAEAMDYGRGQAENHEVSMRGYLQGILARRVREELT